MASAHPLSPNLSPEPTPSARSSSTGRSHYHFSTTRCVSIAPAHFERTDRKCLALKCGESVESRGARRVTAKSLLHCKCKRSEVSCNAELARGMGIRGTEGEGGGDGGGEAVVIPEFDISRLEAYTERFLSELLIVRALVEDEEAEEAEEEEDEVIVFKGYSSSLTRATPDDPMQPILDHTAVILSIDRLQAPYSPSRPQYIQQGISWQEFEALLEEKGL